jgi:hypothetical protein
MPALSGLGHFPIESLRPSRLFHEGNGSASMFDLLFIALGAGLFALAAGYVEFCGRL